MSYKPTHVRSKLREFDIREGAIYEIHSVADKKVRIFDDLGEIWDLYSKNEFSYIGPPAVIAKTTGEI